MKKAAIFDMDGLMFDTQKLYDQEWENVAKEFGREPSQDFINEIRGTNGPFMRTIVEKHYPGIDIEAFIAREMEKVLKIEETYVPEKPGLHEILGFLKESGLKLAVASSSETGMVHHNLELTGVKQYFDAIICGNEVKRAKPDPEVFLKAAEGVHEAPEDCYVFEDSFAGLIAADKAGCAPVMVPDAVQPTEEIRAICKGVYPSLFAVAEAIRNGEI